MQINQTTGAIAALIISVATTTALANNSTVSRQPVELPVFVTLKIDEDRHLHVGVNEVTVAQWRACEHAGACPTLPGMARAQPDHPVTGVNWFDAQGYIAWARAATGLKLRLPTYDEWMSFADNHGPGKKPKLFTDPRLAWAADYDITAEPAIKTTAPAGAFGSNAYGLMDIKGNVWEWTDSVCDPAMANELGKTCRSGRIAMGKHTASLSELIRDPGNAACGGGLPPANLGFRLVY